MLRTRAVSRSTYSQAVFLKEWWRGKMFIILKTAELNMLKFSCQAWKTIVHATTKSKVFFPVTYVKRCILITTGKPLITSTAYKKFYNLRACSSLLLIRTTNRFLTKSSQHRNRVTNTKKKSKKRRN